MTPRLLPRCLSIAALSACVVPWPAVDDSDADTDATRSDDGETDGGSTDDPPPRSPAKPLDDCKDTIGKGTMKEGEFTGTFEGLTASGLVTACAADWSPPQGIDAFFRVILEPRQTVNLQFTMEGRDVSVFLLRSCKPDACEVGADVGASGGTEGITYTSLAAEGEELIFGAAIYAPDKTGVPYTVSVDYP